MKKTLLIGLVILVIAGFRILNIDNTVADISSPTQQINTESKNQVIVDSPSSADESQLLVAYQQAHKATIGKKHPQLDYFSELSDQELPIKLFTHPFDANGNVELILQLIETGRLEVNQSLKPSTTYYTPLFIALATNHGQITREQFDKFVDLGAYIGSSNTWLRALTSLSVKDPKVVEDWFEAASLGPEYYRRLYEDSAERGNGIVAEYIYHEMGEAASGLYLMEGVRKARVDRLLNASTDIRPDYYKTPGRVHPINMARSTKAKLERTLGLIERSHIFGIQTEAEELALRAKSIEIKEKLNKLELILATL